MTKTCPDHGDYEVLTMQFFDRTIEAGCPECVKSELEQRERVALQELEAENLEAYKAMNLEPGYYHVAMDNFEATSEELVKAKNATQALIDGKLHKLILTGKNGTGKTHLACCAVKELKGRILTMFEISCLIRACYTSLTKKTEIELLDELSRVMILAIDEVGRTKGSESELNWLSYIIDKRHARKLPTILISNNHVKKDCSKGGCERCLEQYMGEDVMSRLADAKLLRFNGEDWRRKRGSV